MFVHIHSFSFIRYEVVEQILKQAKSIIQMNQFAKDNLTTYIIDKAEETSNNIIFQTIFQPKKISQKQDLQAQALKDDSLMNASYRQFDKKQNKKSFFQDSKLNDTDTNPKNKDINFKSLIKPLKQSQELHDQGPQIIKLRQFKQIQQRQRLELTPLERIKQKLSLKKGQRVIFDYEGNAQQGKQLKRDKFHPNIMSTNIEKSINNSSIQKQSLGQKSITIQNKNNGSLRNKERQGKDFQFSSLQKRDLIINTMKLSNDRTKLVFDGHNITNIESQNTNSSVQNTSRKRSLISRVNKTQLRKETEQLKTNQTEDMLMSLPQRQTLKRAKIRTKTQASEKLYNYQKIKVQNENLKRVLFTETEQIHIELPKNRIRRVQTNNNTTITSVDPNLIKIRQKLSIKKSSEKLPQIMSRYLNMQKQYRNKNKLNLF